MPSCYFRVRVRLKDQQLSGIAVLSFGWGFFPLRIAQCANNWSALQWSGVPGFYTPGPKEPQLPHQELMVNGVSDKDTPAPNCWASGQRLNPRLPRRVVVDDLTAFAEAVDLEPTTA